MATLIFSPSDKDVKVRLIYGFLDKTVEISNEKALEISQALEQVVNNKETIKVEIE